MKKLLISIALLLLIYCAPVFSFNLIPVQDLFKPPQISLVSLSPNGDLVGYYQLMEAGHSEIKIYNPNTKTTTKALHVDSIFKLKTFDWIDNETFFVTFREESHDRIGDILKGYVQLPENNTDAQNKFKTIWSDGSLISPLPDEGDTVIFMRDEGGSDEIDLQIYKLSLDDLLNEKFSRKNRLKISIDGALYYSFDDISDVWFAITYSEDDEQMSLHYRPISAKNWQKVYTWKDQDYRFEPVSLMPDGKFLVLTNQFTDVMSAYSFNPQTQELTELLYEHDKYDLTSASVSTQTGKLNSVSFIHNGRLHTEYFSESAVRVQLPSDFNSVDSQIWNVATNQKMQRFIFLVSRSDSPGEYYYLDNKTNFLTKIGTLYPDLDKYSLATTESIVVKNNLGFDIEALLTRPKENTHNVLLVMPHGGPVGVRDLDSYNPLIQYLANRGFSVLRVNFTGSSGFGKDFIERGKAQFGLQIEKDIRLVLEKVKATYNYQRGCSIGASYGGFSAVMLAISEPEFFQCIVAKYGVYDLPLLFNASNLALTEGHRKLISEVLGDNLNELRSNSPVHLIDKIHSPLLLIAGYGDQISGIEQSNRFKYLLQQQDKEVDSMFYYGVGHGQYTWNGEWHESIYIKEFLYRHLNLEDKINQQNSAVIADEMAILGDVFSSGDIVQKQSERGFDYYKSGAELGHPRANYKLGTYYQAGQYVNQDIEIAINFYRVASDGGYGKASFELGLRHKAGNDLPVNEDLATNYLEKAVAQGYKPAVLHLAETKCTAEPLDEQIKDCLSLLTQYLDNSDRVKNQPVNNGDSFRHKTFAKILLNNKFPESDKHRLVNLFTKYYGEVDPTFKIDIEKFKVFEPNSWRSSSYSHRKHPVIPNVQESKARIEYGFESDLPTGPTQFWYYLIKWSYRDVNDQAFTALEYSLHSAQYHSITRANSMKIHKPEIVEKEYKIEFFLLDGTQIDSFTFRVAD